MKEQSTGGSFIALSFASIFVKLLSLLYVPIIIRILGDEGYGIYLASYDIFSLIYVVTNSGMQIAIAKQIAEFVALNQYNSVVKTFNVGRKLMFIIGLISSILLFISSRKISELVGSERAYLGIMFLSPTIFFTCMLAAYRGLFQGISTMIPMAVSQVIEQVCNVLVSIFFAWILVRYGLEFGAAGGTIGTTIGAIVAIIFLWSIIKKDKIIYDMGVSVPYLECELERRNQVSTREILKVFLKYGIPVILTSGIQYIGAVIDLALVKNRLLFAGFDSSTSDILYGLLGKYKTLIYVPLSIIAALSSAVIPSIVKSVVLKDSNELFKKIKFSIKISLLVSIPACVGLSILSKPIYEILFSADYIDGYKLMFYGSSLVIFMSIVQIQTTILQGINKFYWVFISLLTGVLLKLIINYYLIGIPNININGAVIGSIVCFGVPMIINSLLIRRYINFKSGLIKSSIKPLIASFNMALIIVILSSLFSKINNEFGSLIRYSVFMLYILVGIIVYFVSIVLFRYLNEDDLDFLPSAIINRIPKVIKSKFF